MIAYESEHVEVAPARVEATKDKRFLSRLWTARGFFGGVSAIALAFLGQFAIINNNDTDAALRYYVAGFVLLILSLLHPPTIRVPRPRGARLSEQDLAPAFSTLPVRSATGRGLQVAARPVRARAVAGAVIPATKTGNFSPATLWTRYKAFRVRLGWRATIGGFVLAAALAGLSANTLRGNIGSIPGGWLWFASLLALLLTFAGIEGWPRGNGLLLSPRADFFARGLPTPSPRVEAVFVGVILVVALVSRLYNLEYFPGIFGDEGERGLDAWGTAHGDGSPIFGYGWWSVPKLYFYLVGIMLRVFGYSMVGDRMLSVIAGMVCVWYIYKIGRLLWGPRAGLIAGALVAASPLALQYSRQAGESTPTQALWVAGFYYLCLALRHRRPLDWALAGSLWGFSMYFYASGKLILAVIPAVILYCLVRWRVAFFKRYALGFGLMLLAFGLTYMPSLIENIQERWYNFALRSQQTSIFTPSVQIQIMQRFGIPYDIWAAQPFVQSLSSHPATWGRVMWEQVRVSTEVLYRTHDPSFYYQISEHNGSMLSPLLAALALLGLVYAAWKIFDARFALVSILFWGGMMGVILTMDAPTVQRAAGAWPVLLIFPAVVLDRIAAAAWPLHPTIARRWAAVPIVALVLFLGYEGYREYFVHYALMCPFCKATTAARYEQSLGNDYRGYMLGKGDEIFFGYGSARFISNGVEGYDLDNAVDGLPVTDGGSKGLAFMVYPSNAQYLPLLRMLYPNGQEEEIKGVDGRTYFTSYKVSKELLAQLRSTTATYIGADANATKRIEPNLGSATEWSPPAGTKYPAKVSWQGSLIAPAFTTYIFRLRGTETQLVIDGRVLPINPGEQPNSGSVTAILAKGLHNVYLSGTLPAAQSRVDLSWSTVQSAAVPVGANFLLQSSPNRFTIETASGTDPSTLASASPFGSTPVSDYRNYPVTGLREAAEVFSQGNWTTRWQAKINVKAPGTYFFEATVNGSLVLFIDGNQVMNGTGNGMVPVTGSASLQNGEHTFDLRTFWGGGPSPLELYWFTSGQPKELVTSSYRSPTASVWLPGEISNPRTVAGVNLEGGSEEAHPVTPTGRFGVGDLLDPHGIAVDAKGDIYIGDAGDNRIVVYSPDGKVLRQWGKAAEAGHEQNPGPGAFSHITDLTIGPDGKVYVLDMSSGVQAFTPDGKFLWGTGEQKYGMFSPNGIGMASDGNLFLADTGASRVLKLSSIDGKPMGEFRGDDHGDFVRLNQPLDVMASGAYVYTIDLNNRLARVAPEGKITEEWPLEIGGGGGGARMAMDTSGHVYISDPDRARWEDIDLATNTVKLYGGKGTGPGQFDAPTGIAIGPGGKLYVLDRRNGVQVFDPHASK